MSSMDVILPGRDSGLGQNATPSFGRGPQEGTLPEVLEATLKKELQQLRAGLMDDVRVELGRLRMELSPRSSFLDPNINGGSGGSGFQRVLSGGNMNAAASISGTGMNSMNPVGSLASVGGGGNNSFGFGLGGSFDTSALGLPFDEPHAWINRSMRSYCAAEELAHIDGPGLEKQERFSSKTTLLSEPRQKGQGPWARSVGMRRRRRISTAPTENTSNTVVAAAAAAARATAFTGSPVPTYVTPSAIAPRDGTQPATLGSLPILKKMGTSDFHGPNRREHRAPTGQSVSSASPGVRRDIRGLTTLSTNSAATADVPQNRGKRDPSPSPSVAGASSSIGGQQMSSKLSRSSSCAARIMDQRDSGGDGASSFGGGLNFSERGSDRSPRSIPLPTPQLNLTPCPPSGTSEFQERETSLGTGGSGTLQAGVHHLTTIQSVPDTSFTGRTLRTMQTTSVELRSSRKHVLNIVSNIWFDYTTIIFIVANAIVIGLQTDHCARHLQETPPRIFERFEEVFFVFFCLELGLRMYAHGRRFFYMSTWPWNVTDLIIISLQAVENLTFLSGAGMDSALPLNLLRILRILRLIRVLRVVKLLRYMSELRTIIVSIMASMKALLSTIVLLMLVIFIVACYITQLTLTSYLDCSKNEECNMENNEILREFSGSLGITVLHLFQTVFGGLEWRHMVDPMVTTISPLMGLLFCLYVVFTALALMNIVTGVFVETALQRGREDKDVLMINQLRDLFGKLDEYRSGTISWEQMAEKLSDPNLLTFFKDIDLDVSEARGLFHLLDRDGSGVLDADEFLSGCLRLRGPAKSLDIQLIMRELSEQRRVMVRLASIVCRANDMPTMVSTGFPDFLTPPASSGQETSTMSY